MHTPLHVLIKTSLNLIVLEFLDVWYMNIIYFYILTKYLVIVTVHMHDMFVIHQKLSGKPNSS